MASSPTGPEDGLEGRGTNLSPFAPLGNWVMGQSWRMQLVFTVGLLAANLYALISFAGGSKFLYGASALLGGRTIWLCWKRPAKAVATSHPEAKRDA
jgi:hypothetical protein